MPDSSLAVDMAEKELRANLESMTSCIARLRHLSNLYVPSSRQYVDRELEGRFDAAAVDHFLREEHERELLHWLTCGLRPQHSDLCVWLG